MESCCQRLRQSSDAIDLPTWSGRGYPLHCDYRGTCRGKILHQKFDEFFDLARTQSSFAFRLWKLSKTRTLPLISLALCLLAQSIALTMTVKAFTMTDLVTFETNGKRLITLSLTSRLVCELTLTLSMVWYLRRQRSSTFSRHVSLLPICSLIMIYRTTTIIDRLVLWTVGEHCARSGTMHI